MTAAELIATLKTEAQALINNVNVTSIEGITFIFNNGTEKVIKLNPDKTWMLKPTESNGFVRIKWTDSEKNFSSVNGNIYTIVEKVKSTFIDPAEVTDFQFDYTITRESNINVDSDTDGE